VSSDAALLEAARKQLALAGDNAAAFLGWRMAWKDQRGVDRDDLIDLVKDAGLDTGACT